MNLRDALDIVVPDWEHPMQQYMTAIRKYTLEEAYEHLSIHEKAVVDTLILRD